MSQGAKRPPLAGVRVIDLGQIYSVPFAGAMLADMGAEVIKIEGPDRMDVTRMNGVYADADPGADPWNRISMYNVVNRGKKSLVLDLRSAEGRAILRALIARSDIVMENFTPRVMKNWGLDYATLSQELAGLIMVSNTGYGQGPGPYADYPAQATTQEATHGLAHVTGYRGDLPSKAGASYIDFLAASACLSGIALALRRRRRTGRGQWIEIGMYQIGCFTVGEYIMDWLSNARRGERIGNRHPWLAPQGCYPCAGEDQWCVLTVRSDDDWRAFCRAIGQDALVNDARFATNAARMQHHDVLDDLIAGWSRKVPRDAAVGLLRQAGIPASAVQNAHEVHFDPHLRARGFMEAVDHPAERFLGRRRMMGRGWRHEHTPLTIQGPAPAFGEHSRAILHEVLGYDAAHIDDLERRGITATKPVGRPLAAHAGRSMAEMVALGLYQSCDEAYRE
ncbi:MAG: CaiB/BaiF CoA transferase family protein [Burkholderiaceae bacterium]